MHRLTRKDLASLLGVTDRSVYYWENGLRLPSQSLKILLTQLDRHLLRKVELSFGTVINFGKDKQARVMSIVDYAGLPENEKPDLITIWESQDTENGCIGEKTLCEAGFRGTYIVLAIFPKG